MIVPNVRARLVRNCPSSSYCATHSVRTKSDGVTASAVLARTTGRPNMRHRPTSKKMLASVGGGVASEKMATPSPHPRIGPTILSR